MLFYSADKSIYQNLCEKYAKKFQASIGVVTESKKSHQGLSPAWSRSCRLRQKILVFAPTMLARPNERAKCQKGRVRSRMQDKLSVCLIHELLCREKSMPRVRPRRWTWKSYDRFYWDLAYKYGYINSVWWCHRRLLQLDSMRLLINTVFDLKMLNWDPNTNFLIKLIKNVK